MKPVFAIDVGGVLASKQHDGEPRAGAQEALAALQERFDLWVVSQCGSKRAVRTIEWLHDWGFPIPLEHQIYVPMSGSKVPELEKIAACYFVDDRLKHVLPALYVSQMATVFHLPEAALPAEYRSVPAHYPQKYQYVAGWADVIRYLTPRVGC